MDPVPVNAIDENSTPPFEVPPAFLGHAHPGGLQHLSHNSSSQRLHPTTSIILRISPAAGSATFGYIYIAKDKHHQPKVPSPPTSTVWDGRSPSFCVPTLTPSWPSTLFWSATCPLSPTCPNTSSLQALLFYKQLNTTFPPITTGSQPHQMDIMGGGLPSSSSARRPGPASSPSSTFCHGGGSNLSDYTASEWGSSSADITSSWSMHTSCSSYYLCIFPSRHDSHASQRPDPNSLDASHAPPSFHHLISHYPIPPSSYWHISHAPVQTIFTGGNPSRHGGMSPRTYQGSRFIGEGMSLAVRD
jgi:hypothetical protein